MAPASTEWAQGSLPTMPPNGIKAPEKPETRILIEKTAGFAGRRKDMQAQLVETAKSQPNMAFVFAHDQYHPYYQWRIAEIVEGRSFDPAAQAKVAVKKRHGPPEPAAFAFSARMPIIREEDLDVLKLTALYTAVKGSGWMTRMSQRYGTQAQFSFLKPQHSYHQFFNRLVEQYKEILPVDGGDLAKRQALRLEELERNITDPYPILDRAKQRAEYVSAQENKKTAKLEADKAEQAAYAQIDWHDFAIVATIEFTEADERATLPEPQSLNDLQSQSLEQKADWLPSSMRLEEAMPEEFAYLATQSQPQYQPPPQTHTPQPAAYSPLPYAPTPSHASPSPAPYIPAQASYTEDAQRIAERQAEAERASAARAAASGTGPMKIVSNYVPRAQARRTATTTALCPICKQQIPADEYSEHVRIEQLDPRWREQTRIAQQRSATTNLSTFDVANNLKRLASARSDVFDPVTGREIEGRETKRQEVVPPGGVGQQSARPTDVEGQVRAIREKYGQQ